MKPKPIKIPHRLRLNAGTHIIVPGSTLGGTRKSTMIITAACVCAQAGLNYTVVTLDRNCQSLQPALGGIVVIPSITSESGRQSLLEITEKAKANNSIILMDIPGVFLGNSETWDEIRSYFENFDSVGVIAPIDSDQWNQKCALSAIEFLQPDHVLVSYHETNRNFGRPSTTPVISDKLSQYPYWQTRQMRQDGRDMLSRRGRFAQLPLMPEIPSYLATNGGKLDELLELDLEDFIHDIEIAGEAIYEHLLKPITTVVDS